MVFLSFCSLSICKLIVRNSHNNLTKTLHCTENKRKSCPSVKSTINLELKHDGYICLQHQFARHTWLVIESRPMSWWKLKCSRFHPTRQDLSFLQRGVGASTSSINNGVSRNFWFHGHTNFYTSRHCPVTNDSWLCAKLELYFCTDNVRDSVGETNSPRLRSFFVNLTWSLRRLSLYCYCCALYFWNALLSHYVVVMWLSIILSQNFCFTVSLVLDILISLFDTRLIFLKVTIKIKGKGIILKATTHIII